MASELPLRFALIGCGRIALRHAEHIRSVGKLTGVCDSDLQSAQHLGSANGVPFCTSVDELLSSHADDIDVASICTPNALHAPHTIAALRAGCHVLCEKPMATTSEDCGQMLQEAERNNRRLFVVKQNRFNPPVVAVKKLIDAGRLGRIFSVHLNCIWNRNEQYYENSWKGSTDLDGGCLFTQFSHFIDLLYWLVGDVGDVSAFVDNFCHKDTVDFEDSGVVALRFRCGALGSIHFSVNSHEKNMEGSLTILGEHGTVKIGGQYLNELEYQNIDSYEITDLPIGRGANDYGSYVGSMSNHDKVYENVADVLQGNGVIVTNAFEGLKTVEIIEKIYAAVQCSLR